MDLRIRTLSHTPLLGWSFPPPFFSTSHYAADSSYCPSRAEELPHCLTPESSFHFVDTVLVVHCKGCIHSFTAMPHTQLVWFWTHCPPNLLIFLRFSPWWVALLSVWLPKLETWRLYKKRLSMSWLWNISITSLEGSPHFLTWRNDLPYSSSSLPCLLHP